MLSPAAMSTRHSAEVRSVQFILGLVDAVMMRVAEGQEIRKSSSS